MRAMGALGEMEWENLGVVGGDFELGLPGSLIFTRNRIIEAHQHL